MDIRKKTASLKDFKFIPSTKYTLVSINKYLLKRWKIEGNKTIGLRVSKLGATVTFDLPIYASKRVLFTLHGKRQNPDRNSMDYLVSCFSCKYTYQQAH